MDRGNAEVNQRVPASESARIHQALALVDAAAVFRRFLLHSPGKGPGWSWSPGRGLVSLPCILQPLWFTVWQAALSTLLTLLVGLPAAYVFTRYNFSGKRACACW